MEQIKHGSLQDHPETSDRHYLYRFEAEGLYHLTNKIVKRGIFHIPETWIADNPESSDGVNAILKFYAFFEDKLECPVIPSDMSTISFFTEDGLRKFRKQLKYCKTVLETRGYAWYRHRTPAVDEAELHAMYRDKYQVIYERTKWISYMTDWMIAKGSEEAVKLKERMIKDGNYRNVRDSEHHDQEKA